MPTKLMSTCTAQARVTARLHHWRRCAPPPQPDIRKMQTTALTRPGDSGHSLGRIKGIQLQWPARANKKVIARSR